MDAKDHAVISVLGDQRRFMVPIFQRQYSWREQRLRPFWEDVLAKAEETLQAAPKFKHYMGALILAPGGQGYVVGVTPRVQVIDGQQRLTTFQLFLAALREVGDNLGFQEVREAVGNYLFNRPMTGDVDEDARFKLVPTPEDRVVFKEIVDGGWKQVRKARPSIFYQNGNLKAGQAPNSVRAFDFFTICIRQYVLFGPPQDDEINLLTPPDDEDTQRRRISALLEALLNHLKLVVITLDESDDAQVIFETLNSRGEPLLAMDLVRNNIFHRAQAQGEKAEELFLTKWRPLDGPFWKDDAPRAKPRRPRIDHFLSHALTAQTGEEVSLRELYAEYRAFARPKGAPRFATVEGELDALLHYAPIYRALEGLPDKAAEEPDANLLALGRKLATWEVGTAYPLVFCVAGADIAAEEKAAIYRLIYSYIVRRAICGLTAKNLNKNFQRIVSHLLTHGVSSASFAASLVEQTGPTVRFPDDAEVKLAVKTVPIYRNILRSERLQDMLWEMEQARRTKFSVATPRPDSMSIEHVLPQGWTSNWPLPDGRDAPADKLTGADQAMLDAISARERLVHTLGNLTLVTVPANSVASNSAFDIKRTWLQKSLLALNLEILQRPSWDETEIEARAANLGDLAVQIWPGIAK
ncbi:DUF262 domain-containing protein [Phenylobacterium sp.]|uniref:DUF262 domain-containing protein n=1 Tax=Phenylobacterium sp. TaxID=1871053 RepID=UPI003D282478